MTATKSEQCWKSRFHKLNWSLYSEFNRLKRLTKAEEVCQNDVGQIEAAATTTTTIQNVSLEASLPELHNMFLRVSEAQQANKDSQSLMMKADHCGLISSKRALSNFLSVSFKSSKASSSCTILALIKFRSLELARFELCEIDWSSKNELASYMTV